MSFLELVRILCGRIILLLYYFCHVGLAIANKIERLLWDTSVWCWGGPMNHFVSNILVFRLQVEKCWVNHYVILLFKHGLVCIVFLGACTYRIWMVGTHKSMMVTLACWGNFILKWILFFPLSSSTRFGRRLGILGYRRLFGDGSNLVCPFTWSF